MCVLDSRWRQVDITQGGVEGVCSDSSSVDNKALAVNVLLPGTLQGRNLLQMLEADVQLVVVVVAMGGWVAGGTRCLRSKREWTH